MGTFRSEVNDITALLGNTNGRPDGLAGHGSARVCADVLADSGLASGLVIGSVCDYTSRISVLLFFGCGHFCGRLLQVVRVWLHRASYLDVTRLSVMCGGTVSWTPGA